MTAIATQPSLFGYAPDGSIVPPAAKARRTDPDTSHDVANDRTLRAVWNTERRRLLTAFTSTEAFATDGLTDERAAEIANETGKWIDPAVESTRRCCELRDAGLLELTGDRRKKSSGRKGQVSRITVGGRNALVGARQHRKGDAA